MSRLAEKLADQIAAECIRHIEKTGDEDIVTVLSQVMGDSSQTLQEAFITSARGQRAALRAQRILARRVADAAAASGKDG